MWLTSYDTDPAWGPIEAYLLGGASIGQRTDWAWATLEPSLLVGGEAPGRVLLAARHQGDSVWSEPERCPIHVYVCVPELADLTGNQFTQDQVTIAYRGLLHRSRERAEVEQY